MIKSIAQPLKVFLYGSLILATILSIEILFWWDYPLELLCNFRVYYLLLAGGIAIALLLYQLKGFSVKLALYFAFALTAFNSVWIVPWYLPHAQQGSENSIRVLTFNINMANTEWDAIANAVLSVKPDIATIIESSAESQTELSKRFTNLPFVYRSTGAEITIFSRFPLISPQSKIFNNGTVLLTAVQIDQKTVQLIAVHPSVPVKPGLSKRRNAFLAEFTAYLQQQTQKSLIVLGDFNLTPWSPHYSQLVGKTGLHNTRLGFGVEPSWIEATTYARYSTWLTAPVKIPIDHIFVSSDIKVHDCKTTKAANSDHRMLWSNLVL